MKRFYSYVTSGDGPVLATAIHDGHALRDELTPYCALSSEARLREEDPGTGDWAGVAPHQVVVHHSRFEVDLNRPRGAAVYQGPADAWGLNVWTTPLPAAVVARSLAQYDRFYDSLHAICSALAERWGQFVILDLHSYNHRRDGADAPPAPAESNPAINLGTGSMDRTRWAPVVEVATAAFAAGGYDVRENVRFRGGHLSRWIHETFPGTGCALAIEFKKLFMDEWTGQFDLEKVAAIRSTLQRVASEVLTYLEVS